jgi:hypothetical protein
MFEPQIIQPKVHSTDNIRLQWNKPNIQWDLYGVAIIMQFRPGQSHIYFVDTLGM